MDLPKHQLNKVLKRLMVECDIDDAKLAQATNVPFTTIARMRANSGANPTASSLRPIAKHFGISISQLLGDEPLSPERLFIASKEENHTATRVPLIPWTKILQWAHTDKLNHDDIQGWLSVDLPLSATSFAVKIENSAFGDRFKDNMTLIVDPVITPHSGDIVLIKTNSDPNVLLKEILFDGQLIYLKSVNPELTQAITLEEPYQHCGVIVETRQILHTKSFDKVKRTVTSYQTQTEVLA